jgi:PAS domain S-box-containing protein
MLKEAGEPPPKLSSVGRLDEAIKRLSEEQFDAVLLDLGLPDSSGIETFLTLRNSTPHPPAVVVLTGMDDEELAMRAVREGAQDYLVKWQISGHLLVRSMRYAVERKASEERLRRERDLLNRVAETSPAGIIMLDRGGEITFANPHAEQMLGLVKGEREGQTVYSPPSLEVLGPDGRALPEEELTFRTVLKSGKPLLGVRRSLQLPDGRRLVISTNAAPLLDSDGRPEGVVALFEDITQQLLVEDELISINRALEVLSICNEAMIRAANEGDLLQEVCRIIVDLGGYRMAWVGLAEHDEPKTVRPVAWAGHEDGYLQNANISLETTNGAAGR